MPKRAVVVLFIVAMAIVPAAAKVPGLEFDYPVVASRWNVELGGFAAGLDTSVAASYRGTLGSFINLEDLLGLEANQDTFRMDGFYRIKAKHTLVFDLLSIRRSASQMLDQGFTFDDREFALGGMVSSQFNMDVLEVLYEYSFINNGRISAGITAGLSFFDLSGDLSGEVVLRDDMGNQTGTEFASAGSNFLAPVPSYGMFIDYGMAKWAILRVRANSLNLSLKDIEGRFLDSRVTVDFYVTKHFAIGAGLSNTTLEYTDNGSNPFRIDYRYGGLVTYLAVSF